MPLFTNFTARSSQHVHARGQGAPRGDMRTCRDTGLAPDRLAARRGCAALCYLVSVEDEVRPHVHVIVTTHSISPEDS